MHIYQGPERRSFPRVEAKLVTSYQIEVAGEVNISQTKNISLGGALLTTHKRFPQAKTIKLKIRVPSTMEIMQILADIVNIREVASDSIYNTHLKFKQLEGSQRRILKDTIDNYKVRADV